MPMPFCADCSCLPCSPWCKFGTVPSQMVVKPTGLTVIPGCFSGFDDHCSNGDCPPLFDGTRPDIIDRINDTPFSLTFQPYNPGSTPSCYWKYSSCCLEEDGVTCIGCYVNIEAAIFSAGQQAPGAMANSLAHFTPYTIPSGQWCLIVSIDVYLPTAVGNGGTQALYKTCFDDKPTCDDFSDVSLTYYDEEYYNDFCPSFPGESGAGSFEGSGSSVTLTAVP